MTVQADDYLEAMRAMLSPGDFKKAVARAKRIAKAREKFGEEPDPGLFPGEEDEA